jgi:acyltransferase
MERDYGVVGALWFLPALFAVEVGSALLVRVTRGGVPHGLCVLGLAATGFFWRSFSPVPLPLYWSVSLSGLLFYWAGTRARKGRLAAPEALGTNVIAAAALLPVVALAAPVNGKVSMAGMNYGNPLLFVPIALAGIAMTVAFAGIASRSRGLRFLGRNSLPIMALHLIVFSLLDAVRQAVLGTTYRELKGSLAAGLVHLALILAFLALLTPVINRITSRVSGR